MAFMPIWAIASAPVGSWIGFATMRTIGMRRRRAQMVAAAS